MVSVKIYVEGGGDSKEQQSRCREGFSKLIEKAGFQGRMPSIVACGGRDSVFDNFKIAVNNRTTYSLLLVDSEDPVQNTNTDPDSTIAWDHLLSRDAWTRPNGVKNDQALLMVTSMETWIMADPNALHVFFGQSLQVSALLSGYDLEAKYRGDVLQALDHATRNCHRDKRYKKGTISFKVLANVTPGKLKRLLPHFERLISVLERHL
jgi:hypothetical protein